MANAMGLYLQAQTAGFDRAAVLRHVRAAQYVTSVVLDDLQLAVELGIPYAIYRKYGCEPQPDRNDQNAGFAAADRIFEQLVSWRRTSPGSENVHFLINNEQGFGVGVSWMYNRLIMRCATEMNPPIGLVIGNWASGAVKCGQAGEPNAWIDAGEPILRAMDAYKNKQLPNGSKAFVIGNHDYTSLTPWIAANGGAFQNKTTWDDRPLSIDWTKPQWHLGRMIQGMMAACKHFGIPTYPPVIITESLFDTMDDVINRLGPIALAPDADKPRGWRSLKPQWAKWYPGVDPAVHLARCHVWAWETIYKPLGFVIGTTNYCYGNTGDWWTFRVDEPDGAPYLQAMEAYNQPTPIPTRVPTPDPVPVPIPPADSVTISREQFALFRQRVDELTKQVDGWIIGSSD